MTRPRIRCAEARTSHSRLIKCTLAAVESQIWWKRGQSVPASQVQDRAFEEFWFGERSHRRVRELVAILRTRFDTYPSGLAALRAWPEVSPETRALICHWHIQLTDPIYRRFTSEFLDGRRQEARAEVNRPVVISWLSGVAPEAWTTVMRAEYATRLLSTATAAGLLAGRRDPRRLLQPRVDDDALSYLLQLLRDIDFEGTLLDNPYLRSVGLGGAALDQRFRKLSCLRYRRMGDAVEWGWRFDSLLDWVRSGAGMIAGEDGPDTGKEEAT